MGGGTSAVHRWSAKGGASAVHRVLNHIPQSTLIHSCSLFMSCVFTPGVAIGSFLVLVAEWPQSFLVLVGCRLFVGGHRPSDVLSLRFIHDTHSDPPVGMCLF